MRALRLLFIALAATVLSAPALAEPASVFVAEGQLLVARKDDRERGRGEGRRERGGHEDRGVYDDHGGGHERRRISRGEAAQRAKGGGRGRVLGVEESQHDESDSGYDVRILDGGRLRTIRVPAEDE